MAGNKNKDFKISENLRRINIVDDFWELAKECRQSHYYLRSLKNFLNGSIVLKDNGKDGDKFRGIEMEVKDLNSRIVLAEDNFQLLEASMVAKKNEHDKSRINKSTEEAAATQLNDSIDTDLFYVKVSELFQLLIKFVKLKEEIDKLQLDILVCIGKNRSTINQIVSKKNSKLETVYTQCIENSLIETAFNHSVDEDKIDTYEFYAVDNEARAELKKSGIVLPYCLKVVDYSFNIKANRKILENYLKLTLKLLDMNQRIDEENELKKLNHKQYYFNIVVTIFTIIATICSIISLKYTIKDHSKISIKDSTYIVENPK